MYCSCLRSERIKIWTSTIQRQLGRINVLMTDVIWLEALKTATQRTSWGRIFLNCWSRMNFELLSKHWQEVLKVLRQIWTSFWDPQNNVMWSKSSRATTKRTLWWDCFSILGMFSFIIQRFSLCVNHRKTDKQNTEKMAFKLFSNSGTRLEPT